MSRDEPLFRRLIAPLAVTDAELDRATPPAGWRTWDDFVGGKPRDTELYKQQMEGKDAHRTMEPGVAQP